VLDRRSSLLIIDILTALRTGQKPDPHPTKRSERLAIHALIQPLNMPELSISEQLRLFQISRRTIANEHAEIDTVAQAVLHVLDQYAWTNHLHHLRTQAPDP
jgi:hypothetical protein